MKRKKTGGRKAGTPNKISASVKEALEQAFDGIGGIAKLIVWARNNPDEFYTLWAKMLPRELKGEITGKAGAPLVERQGPDYDWSKLSNDEIEILEGLMKKASIK